MRKRFLSLCLVATLVVGCINPSNLVRACTISVADPYQEGDDMIYLKYIEGISQEGIDLLDEIAIYNEDDRDSELVMLNDILERSYNNNFDVKSYIIKSKSKTLDGTYWSKYIQIRSDVLSVAYFDRPFAVHYIDKAGIDWYYHSITAQSYPSGMHFNDETNKIDEKIWNKYISGIRDAEKQIGYVTIKDKEYKDNSLCVYELMRGAIRWVGENVEYGSSPDYNNQIAISAVLGHTPTKEDPTIGRVVCSGYAALFNRFMHDFGIESFWIGIPSQDHANNFVKLDGEYYHFDWTDIPPAYKYLDPENLPKYLQGTHFIDEPIYTCDMPMYFIDDKDINNPEESIYSDLPAILHYNNNFVNGKNEELCEDSLGFRPTIENGFFYQKFPTLIWDESRYPIVSLVDVKKSDICPYCGRRHCFPWSEDATVPVKGYPITEHSYSIDALYAFQGHWDENFDYVYDSDVVECKVDICVDDKVIHSEGNYSENITTEPTTSTNQPITTVEQPTTEKPTEWVYNPITGEKIGYYDDDGNIVYINKPTTEEPTTQKKPTVETTKPATAMQETTNKSQGTDVDKQGDSTTVIPDKVKKITAKNNKKKSVKLTWTRSKNAKTYQIQYSTSRKFKKKVKTKTAKKLKYTIRKLVKGKTYYIRVRGVNGKQVGNWSAVKKIKIKK